MQQFRGDAKIPRVANRTWPKNGKIATILNNEFVISAEVLEKMEATPTFALPRQFLVWVAQKVLAQCDIDLVLTEYYKERLGSQLKNRETYTNENKSTEPTVLNASSVPVPSDWISAPKPSSTRPPLPLLTPPLSPLSLSPPLTSAIPSVSCHNNNICPCPQPYITPSPLRTSSNLTSPVLITSFFKGISQKVMAANTPNSESTSSGPHFQAPYVTPMPYPGAPGSPFF